MNYKIILLSIFCFLFINCSENPKTEQDFFIVKVPPIYNDKLSEEENYYRFQHFLFPQEEIPNPIPASLPNDDSLLYVSIDENGKIKLNSQDIGDISNTKLLKEKLTMIFLERKKNRVFESDSQKVVKAVGIKSDLSIKYGDFIKVVEAVNQSNADPIVLLFDNDARPKLKINENKTSETKVLTNHVER